MRALERQDLGVWKRSIFYVLGPIEADMLTSMRQDWKSDYFARLFVFGDRLDVACRRLAACLPSFYARHGTKSRGSRAFPRGQGPLRREWAQTRVGQQDGG